MYSLIRYIMRRRASKGTQLIFHSNFTETFSLITQYQTMRWHHIINHEESTTAWSGFAYVKK